MVGNGSLPINASLASALALHDSLPPNLEASGSGKNDKGNIAQQSTGVGIRKKTSIQALAVHPSLPRVAYLAEETVVSEPSSSLPNKKNKGGVGSSPSSKKSAATQTTVKYQRLIIQQYNRNHDSNKMTPHKYNHLQSVGNDDNKILATLPMEKLPFQINRFRQPRSKSSKLTNEPLTLASLGPLQSITFLDREALFWQTRRQYGSLSNLDAASVAEKEDVVFRADSDWNTVDGGMGHGLCLGLQFARVLVVLRFDCFDVSETFTVLCCLEGQRTTGKDTKVQYTPASSLIPITESIVVYGCSDGAMRFHNLVPAMLYSSKVGESNSDSPSSPSGSSKSTKQTRQTTIKSVRGPNGRNDAVVKVLNVDPVRNDGHYSRAAATAEMMTPTSSSIAIPSQVDNGVESESDDATLVIRSRLLTVCSSGVAFLWDVRVMIDRSSGALKNLNVLPPLVRLDGLGSMTVSPRKALGSSPQATEGGFWGRALAASKSKEGSSISAAPYSRVAPSISYDPHRHLLTWALPADAPAAAVGHRGDYELESLSPNSPQAKKEQEDRLFFDKWVLDNGGFVKVWDLTLTDLLISSAVPSSSPRPPPKMPPIAIMKLPTSVASAESLHSMVAGLPHAPITTASLACVGLSKDGSKLVVVAAPLPVAVDNAGDPAGTTQSSSIPESPVKNKRNKLGAAKVAKPKVFYVNSVPCHSVSLAGGGAISPFVRGSAVAASHLTSDFVGVSTDHGVAIAHLVDGESWSSKLNLLSGDGLSNKNDFSRMQTRPSNVPAGPIHTIISIGGVGNRPGILFVENHAVYASRLGTTRAPNDHKQAVVENVDLPDANALCKLNGREVPWRTIESTRMANFVHSDRLMSCPPRLISSPSGRYLCLYWRDSKSYEILHAGSLLARDKNNPGGPANALDGPVAPSVDSGNDVLSFAWVGDDDNFAILRQHADPSFPSDWDSNSTHLPYKGKRPQVELFKLAEVEVDAVELAAGASVAAATTVRLGSLNVRGGDRVIPHVLFGGPALCVGCLSVSDFNTSDDEGIAYFYSRKGAAIETHDERASVYTTIGTSIPYPDLVTWDECGQLCAISYGSRVAIYVSEESKFMLLGSIRVVGSESSGAELPLISLKFIHGVLYCSTLSSVHVIFLGNLEEYDTVCELDSYTIATNDVPLYGTNNPDLSSPVPVITALTKPHILAYHSGGLLVSTLCGLRLLPLSHPMIRIGTLLAANLTDRARKWILAIPKSEHDNLANFLSRRGFVDLAINDLNGLSLETYIDLCMRYEHTDELEHLIDTCGSDILNDICDWGRWEAFGGYSGYFAIGMYLLGKDKIGCARTLVIKATESGINELLADAMKLATFISVVDQAGGNALLQKVTHAMDFNANVQLALANIVN